MGLREPRRKRGLAARALPSTEIQTALNFPCGGSFLCHTLSVSHNMELTDVVE